MTCWVWVTVVLWFMHHKSISSSRKLNIIIMTSTFWHRLSLFANGLAWWAPAGRMTATRHQKKIDSIEELLYAQFSLYISLVRRRKYIFLSVVSKQTVQSLKSSTLLWKSSFDCFEAFLSIWRKRHKHFQTPEEKRDYCHPGIFQKNEFVDQKNEWNFELEKY